MWIEFDCPGCGQGYRLAAKLAGKRAHCKQCGQVILVPKESFDYAETDVLDADDELDELEEIDDDSPSWLDRVRDAVAGMPLVVWVGLVVGGLVLIGAFVHSSRGRENVSAPEDVPEGAVVVLVSDLNHVQGWEMISEKLKLMADPGPEMRFGGTSSGRQARLWVRPVADPKAFADRIDFGKVTNVSGRVISVSAHPFTPEQITDFVKRRAGIGEPAQQPSGFDVPDQPGSKRKPDGDAVAASPFKTKPDMPPANDNISRALAALDAADSHRRKEAVEAIARLPWNEERAEEVAERLIPLLDDRDIFLGQEVARTLGIWKATGAVPALASKISNPFLRKEACDALVRIHDPSAIELIVAQMRKTWPVSDEALVAFGADAEPALIAQLKNTDDDVRKRVCEILGQIGGKETVLAMRALPADRDTFVRMAANDAMRKIMARVGPVRTPPKSPSTKPKAKGRN